MHTQQIAKKLKFVCIIFFLQMIVNPPAIGQHSMDAHRESFTNPPMDCWPHTRWWWPGNATSKENITYELEQMRSHGIRGVEQITMGNYYQKGDVEYLSDEYMELVKHTVKEAGRLQMEVSFNFGGPSWIIGGKWVEDKDKSRDMIPTSMDISGPTKLNQQLPNQLIKTSRSWEVYESVLSGDEQLIAVVAGRVNKGIIDPESLIVLTEKVSNGKIEWEVPEGEWEIMCFWLAIDKEHQTVNHFDKDAMTRYCNYLGGEYKKVVGDAFGKTVESFFCDSFELPYLASGIKWNEGLLQLFKSKKGYDLTKYLPAIWWQVGDLSPKIKYDVNQFLAEVGQETFFDTFLSWCEENGVKGRIQAYGFETDILQSAGSTHIPEMEITPGEKDQHAWFDTRIGPKKYVASGAHIYGKKTISVEAFTFLHWERYRATLEEIKIASDGLLRSGATKFYNHSYSASEERNLAPTRRVSWAPQITPINVWWQYYPLLSQYTARCSYLLRQGDFAPDIAIYSPLANQWSKDALNARRWTRDFDWGELGKLLISNGYDFDLLNDDALENIAEFDKHEIKIRNMSYKLLLLPNIEALPLNTLKKIEEFVKGGGTVIALDRLPNFSTGFNDRDKNDREVQGIVSSLFDGLDGKSLAPKRIGAGHTHYLKKVIHREIWWDQYSSVFDPFLKILNQHIAPDFEIDFVHEGIRKNNGLAFLHRKIDEADVYFVTNIQNKPISMDVNFRVHDKNVWEWNPYNGEVIELFEYSHSEKGTKVPLKLAPWESTILAFEKGESTPHVSNTNMDHIVDISANVITAEVNQNGSFFIDLTKDNEASFLSTEIADVPSPMVINGKWNLILESANFNKIEKELNHLSSWTDDKAIRHFSGTGKYSIRFQLPDDYLQPDLKLELDLGKLGNIGEIEINGKTAGTIWMKGQRCEISKLVKGGNNELTILVTNTNINRVSAFTEATPVPDHLVEKYGQARKQSGIPREFGFEPLPPSGLMGPVKIIPKKVVKMKY